MKTHFITELEKDLEKKLAKIDLPESGNIHIRYNKGPHCGLYCGNKWLCWLTPEDEFILKRNGVK